MNSYHFLKFPACLCFCLAAISAHTQETETVEEDLDEIVVKGIFDEPDRVTGSAHRIDEQTLEFFDYDDINRVLNKIPGVYSREEDGAGLRPNIGLRGASADRSQKIALMEDGVLISPAPYSAPAAYFFPLSTRMVGVEVYKGPSSIQYGPQTIGGAINLISASIPSDKEVLAQLSGGSDGYRHFHGRVGGQFEQTGYLLEYVHLGSDGFKVLDDGGDTGFDKNEFVAKVARDFGPGRLQLRLSYADEISNETYLGLTETDFRANPVRRYNASALDRMEWEWVSARAEWEQPWLGGALAVTAYAQTFERAWRKFNDFNGANIRDVLASPDSPFNQLFVSILNGSDTDGVSGSPDDIRIGTNDRSFTASGLQAALRWEFDGAAQHVLEIGSRLHVDKIQRLHDEFGFEQIAGSVSLNDQPRAIVTDNTGFSSSLALWVRDEIDFGRWRLVPGLRIEAIQNSFTNRLLQQKKDNDYVIALPGIGASFDVSEGLHFLVGVHKGFSPATPSLDDGLDPEESVNYELGGRWQTKFGDFEAIGFLNDYSNLTSICTFSSGCAPDDVDSQINAGEVRTQGVEFTWNHELEWQGAFAFPISFSYTYTEAEFREAFSSVNPQFGDVEPGYELPYVPQHRANISLGVVYENWAVQASATHIAKMRDQAGIGPFATNSGSDESTIVDFALNYSVSDRWQISARVDNVLDKEHVVSRRPFGARPSKPRSYQITIAYRN